MKLDTVTTIAIGEIAVDGLPITLKGWHDLRAWLTRIAEAHGTVVATADGRGVTSDQPDEQGERTFVVIVINVNDLGSLRENVAYALKRYGLTSACFATDHHHEPAFATDNGFRPAPAGTVTSAAYAPAHGGYCGEVV